MRIEELENKILDVKKLDNEVITMYEGSEGEYSNKDATYTINGQICGITTVKGNTITVRDAKISATSLALKASEDVTVRDVEVTGSIPKSIAPYIVGINADGYVAVRDCKFNQETAYNAIEVDNKLGLAKSVTIDNIDFGKLSNDGISVYAMAENGVITISNCHFEAVSNAIRISNRDNVKFTVNIINCTVDKWDTNPLWTGLITCIDSTSTSAEEAELANRFAPDKVTINIQT